MSEALRRSRPRRAPRVQYNDDSESENAYAPPTPSSRPGRAARHVQTYRETSDDDTTDDDSDSELESSPSGFQPRTSVRIRRVATQSASVAKKRKVPQATTAGERTTFSVNKRRKTTQLAAKTTKPSTYASLVPPSKPSSNKPIPQWQSLPYFVLVKIMQQAAYPLYGPASQVNPSINWLCATGILCRAFHDACLSTLLYAPPLSPLHRAQSLLSILKRERDGRATLFTSYGAKIRYLDLEVKQLTKKHGIKLDELIAFTPQLEGVRVYSNYDDMTNASWAQPGAKKIRWEYPIDLTKQLEKNNVILKSFEWNGRFPNVIDVLKEAMAAHSRPSFKHLHEVTFLNISLPDKVDVADKVFAFKALGTALKDLPQLRSLSFRSCSMMDEDTVQLLPPNLYHLEITNCLHFTSDILNVYLTSSGASLYSLKLNHNQSMDLGFMAKLKTLCPKLRSLEIDMMYMDPSSWRDRDPLFEELLPKGPPTWPSSLVTVSMDNMRQLTEEDAEEFFASLVGASKALPFLRKLNFNVLLKDASWRDRAKMRQKWIPELEDVFLNKDQPSKSVTKASSPMASRVKLQRHSTRIAEGLLRERSSGENSDDSDEATEKNAHARCDVVKLVISDQRPAETQYRENDFLDSEPSDDDEYRE